MAHMIRFMFNAILTTANDLVPSMLGLGDSLSSCYRYWFSPKQITIIVDEDPDEDFPSEITRNQVFDAAMVYLPTLIKIGPDTKRFKVNKTITESNLKFGVEPGVEVVDRLDNDVVIKWKLTQIDRLQRPDKRFFELSFHEKYKDKVLNGEDAYLEVVMKKSKDIVDSIDKVVKIHGDSIGDNVPITLNHPITFDKLAMDPVLKKSIIDDLERFLKRKEFYKKVGKAWKRGYLLYGPPGTGKSSLIAAMANKLNFDIHYLELTNFHSNKNLTKALVSTPNRTIIVIEDIDCSVEMQVRKEGTEIPNRKLTLSGLLNFLDGLWSSCGDERIVVLTTNYKNRLDPALLRPGRMDMEIPMSYCTDEGFKLLASNYLDIHDHSRFGEIKGLIAKVEVTPAEVSEQLLRSEDPDNALEGVVNFLKRKMEANETEVREPKRLKIGNGSRKGCLRRKK